MPTFLVDDRNLMITTPEPPVPPLPPSPPPPPPDPEFGAPLPPSDTNAPFTFPLTPLFIPPVPANPAIAGEPVIPPPPPPPNPPSPACVEVPPPPPPAPQ